MEQTFANQRKQAWIPQKERIFVAVSAGIALLIFILGIRSMLHLPADNLHTRGFKAAFKNYGSLARICLFFVLAHYAFILVLRKRMVDRWNSLKTGVVQLSRFARRWHTPIAIIAIGLILLHAAGAFLYGMKPDFNNISGLLALFVLFPVPVSGLFRYRRMDRRWHLRLGLGFALLFLLHAFL